jgi:spermidine dehydrogenase
MEEFHHAPMLTVSVAVRNWKFLDKLGISYARWFEGFGWHMGLHRQILIDGKEWMPLDPNKPAVLSMYNPFVSHRGVLPAATQAQMARAELFAMSYDDIANGVREQFTKMFGPVGFDAERDIAGIVANKWGHAYLVPQPGFYFGRNGKPPAVDTLRKRYGRLSFAHSEFHGEQLWFAAVDEAIRASKQALEVV